ncbi:MAG: hypothetical protein ACREYE_19625, partial [Gammaproteobacteria bacterium]
MSGRDGTAWHRTSLTPGVEGDLKLRESEVVNFSIFAAISRREGIPAPVRQARVECRLALAKPANSPQTTS